MPTYLCDDGYAELEITADSARAAAQEYVDGGDWGDDASETSWVTVYVEEVEEDATAADDDRTYTIDYVSGGDCCAVCSAAVEALIEDGGECDGVTALTIDAAVGGCEHGCSAAESHRWTAKGERESIKIAVEPTEPACDHGEHDWRSPHNLLGGLAENPGVQGHGGGVTVAEVCVRCGCGRHTDTWAQDRNDGQQGLESVSYEAGEYTDAIAEYLRGLDVGDLDQSDEREGEGWSTFVAEGPWGWWASVVEEGDEVTAEWHDNEADARSQSSRDADNLAEQERA